MAPAPVSVTDFKRRTTRIIALLQASREPLAIMDHDREAAMLMEVTTFRLQTRKIALLEGLIRGRQAMAQDRTLDHDEVMARTAKWA